MIFRKFLPWLSVCILVGGAAAEDIPRESASHAADPNEVEWEVFSETEGVGSLQNLGDGPTTQAPENIPPPVNVQEMDPVVDDRGEASSSTERPLGPFFDLNVENDSFTGQVTYIYDGDTIKVTGQSGDEDVRLLGINTPEVAHPKYGKLEGDPGGEEAKLYIENMLLGKIVTVIYQRSTPRDHYGRILGIVFLGQACVNMDMMMRGHATPLLFDDNTIINAPEWMEFHARAMKRLTAQSGLAKGSPQLEAIASYLMGAAVSKAYILRPYDTIRIQSRDPKHLNVELMIPPDGNIHLPLLGKGNAIKTVDELADELTRAAGGEQILVMLIRSDFQQVREQMTQILQNELKKSSVGGVMPSVIAEGLLWKGGYWQAASIAQLIALVAPQAEADLSNIRLTRASGQTMTINWLAFRAGDISQNVPLENDDVVSFPPKPAAAPAPKIIIAGAVEKPGSYSVGSLLQLLMQVSPKGDADLTRVIHYSRKTDTEGREVYDPRIENFAGIDMGARFADIGLRDGDVIMIPAKPGSGQVLVFGEVRQQGYYQVADLISVLSFAQMSEDARKQVRILRGDTETIIVDLGRIMSGKDRNANIPLYDGDKILVGKMVLSQFRDLMNAVNPMANTLLNFKDLSDALQNKK